MNRDLGLWKSEDCALVLIDYQPEQMESIRSETPADLIELHTRWLIRTAKAFVVPIVVSTVGVESGRLSGSATGLRSEERAALVVGHGDALRAPSRRRRVRARISAAT